MILKQLRTQAGTEDIDNWYDMTVRADDSIVMVGMTMGIWTEPETIDSFNPDIAAVSLNIGVAPTLLQDTTRSSSRISLVEIIGISVGVAVVLAALLIGLGVFRSRRRRKSGGNNDLSVTTSISTRSRQLPVPIAGRTRHVRSIDVPRVHYRRPVDAAPTHYGRPIDEPYVESTQPVDCRDEPPPPPPYMENPVNYVHAK